MSKIVFSITLFALSYLGHTQDTKGNFLSDKKRGCTVWFKNGFPEDSTSWSGQCKNGLADGTGTMIGFTKGQPTSKYVGEMSNGKPHGKGVFTFGGGLKLEGNFSNGEILNLRPDCLKRFYKNEVFRTDSFDYYIGDNAEQKLYYHAIVPAGQIKGAVVLLPGTWETTEHVISSTRQLCEMAYDANLAVIVPSINQRLTMTQDAVTILNSVFKDAIRQYKIPKEMFVMGGFSMGGLFSLRYTELANENAALTSIKPLAVFSCDGPSDLEHLYRNFQKKLTRFPGAFEPGYGIKELEKYCGGDPSKRQNQYVHYSSFSQSQPDGGNAKFLKDTPIRIYNDVDPNWWMNNRGVDMYDMNALDQTAMVLLLKDMGNKNAEFINAYGKGYRIEGNRHPHSWSIVDPKDTIDWILKQINQYPTN